MIRTPCLLVLFAAASACSPSASVAADAADAGGDASDGSVSCLACSDAGAFDAPLSVQVRGVIDRICASVDGCHGSGAGSMPLVGGDEFTHMIGVVSTENPPMLRVAPFDPSASYVYLKVACDGGISGSCMPRSSGYDPQIARMFHDWIEAGAPVSP